MFDNVDCPFPQVWHGRSSRHKRKKLNMLGEIEMHRVLSKVPKDNLKSALEKFCKGDTGDLMTEGAPDASGIGSMEMGTGNR